MDKQTATKHAPATPLQFMLRSHEIMKPGGDGTYHVNATYTILKDGEPLGFTEHCNAVARLNACPQLVAALRWSLAQATHDQRNSEWGDKTTAILRSLGESA